MRADDVHRLSADFPDKLRLFAPALFLLFVKYRADAAVVGVVCIVVQGGDILLLFVGITDYQRPLADTGLRCALCVTAVMCGR